MSAKGQRGYGSRLHYSSLSTWALTFLWCLQISAVLAVSPSKLSSLRRDTSYLFYHGFDGYMKYAFPEDELRPVTCDAFTRDFENQNNWGVNDPLGDYSLTLVDSLSTLAILASSSESEEERKRSLGRFQESVRYVVELYGDGSEGPSGEGERARGFDLDSKVQVFETAIRGLGGLLSAHLFASGDLPIRDYNASQLMSTNGAIRWSKSFHYDGQLLRLAHDLGRRLLPAFSTQTGIPYPRVNLKYGIPFYPNAPQNCGLDESEEGYGFNGQCAANPRSDEERTDTCSAGAGSLVLEFSTLSRLTGDERFEKLSKRAYWAVWERRMPNGLVGSGIDSETGEWKGPPSTGIGAGIDSFYEYAIKSYILLSGAAPLPSTADNSSWNAFEPAPLSDEEDRAESFLSAWQEAQQSIRRHVYQGENVVHPYYAQVNLYNAAHQANWIDSLSAFYSGSLVLAGDIEEAAVTHLLFTALWARYAALPERWSTGTGDIEHGLPWWPGRPEFIESAYYLFRATDDPWYVHVGEMTLRDIKRRCWTPCGWAGLQDVRTGELTDRMESFFLGETVKYLHLLFDPDHPLNHFDAPWVFSTEGHPLIIPKKFLGKETPDAKLKVPLSKKDSSQCPVAPSPLPFTISNTAARSDLFHAAALVRLHLVDSQAIQESALLATSEHSPGISVDDVYSPTNRSFYPWTLPKEYVPPSGTCAPIQEAPTFHITFPTPSALVINVPNHRTMKGIFMNNLAGIRLSMIQEVSKSAAPDLSFRVHMVNNQPIGRDEQLYVSQDTLRAVMTDNDPNFSKVRDSVNLQFVFDTPKPAPTPVFTADNISNASSFRENAVSMVEKFVEGSPEEKATLVKALTDQANAAEGSFASAFRFLADKVTSKLSQATSGSTGQPYRRHFVSGIVASGAGSAPLPNVPDVQPPDSNSGQPVGDLVWNTAYHVGELCDERLPADVATTHQVLVIKRGRCSFSEKLKNIPSFTPSKRALQLVVMVDDPEEEERHRQLYIENGLDPSGLSFRPVLDKQQKTPSGLLRRHPIPLIMVQGGDDTYEALKGATAFGIKRRYTIQAQGVPITNVHVL